MGLADDVLASIAGRLEQARCLEGPDFEIVNSSTLDSLRDHVGPVQPKGYRRCRVAELRTVVTSSGVYVCPYHRESATRPFDGKESDEYAVYLSDMTLCPPQDSGVVGSVAVDSTPLSQVRSGVARAVGTDQPDHLARLSS